MPKDARMTTYRRRYRPYPARKRPARRVASVTKKPRFSIPNLRLNVPRGIFGLPEELKTVLRYVDTYTLTSSTQAVAKQSMRLNSLHDPDSTGVGHQPLYYDQLSSIYGRYVVLCSTMTATFSALPSAIATAQPSGPMLCGVYSDDNGTISTTVSTLMEANTGKSTFLCNQNGGNNVKVFKINYDPDRDLGVSADDDTVGADVGNNPSKVWFGSAWLAESGLSTASSCNVKIEIDFYVKFSKQADVAQS